MHRITIVSLFLGIGYAQVPTVPNTTFPIFHTNLNTSLQRAVDINGNYVNPTWITSLPFSKITGFGLSSVTGLFSGCSGTMYLGFDGACHTAAGSGIVVMTTGSGDPSANCTAPSTSNLALYTQTTNQDIWACVTTNTWKKILSTNNTGTYTNTGLAGTAPLNPAAGSVTCYYSSVSLTQICLDTSGNVFSSVKTAASRTANQFITHIPATGIPTTAVLVTADMPFAPLRSSTTLPGTCTTGELYFKTDATAGQNIYECTATNTWTQQTGGGGFSQTTIFSGGTKVQRAIECTYGTTAYTALTAAASSQEITILTSMAGNVLYDRVALYETTQFTGTTGLSVSVGRPGTTTHAELSGGTFALMVSSGDANVFEDRPSAPQYTSTYSLVLNFITTSGNVNAATAGSLKWKVCGYASE